MKKTIFTTFTQAIVFLIFLSSAVFAQTSVRGKLTDNDTKEPLIGANIIIKDKVIGTTTDIDGAFVLKTNTPLPFTLVISVIGYETKEVNITSNNQEVNVYLSSSTIMGQEVVVSASRIQESILESPVTIEKMDIIAIRESATPDFYDAIANMKGVHVNKGSLTFSSVNTRGFASNANVRFVQLIDGMDNSAPLLNFPTGNLVGIHELDLEAVELVPGAASALYGPNAFNGILFMNSKSPFDYQGLSAQVKTGITRSDAQGESFPMYEAAIRYAKSFNNKLAVKVNFSILDAEDWVGNDYRTDRRFANLGEQVPNDTGLNPTFDGMNLYGDEFQITVPLNGALADAIEVGALSGLGIPADPTLAAGFRTLDNIAVTRTGLREEDLIDDYEARTVKADAALHYRINDNIEALYNFRYGTGSTIYQGGEKYAIRGFRQMFHKVEVKSQDYFVRGYATLTDAGDSYNMTALATFANEDFAESSGTWVPTYGVIYGLSRLGLGYLVNPQLSEGQILSEADAHRAARAAADAGIPDPSSTEFQNVIRDVRENRFFQRQPAGSRFIDNSRTYHAEAQYNFSNKIDWAEILVGGNFRRYSLLSEGTIFNEDPDNGENFERIGINEFGFYGQISKKVFNERLKLTGSLRYDKNENFEGQVTPRISAVVKAADNHNFRTSFQTGFRNPDTQAQFIYFPSTSGILLGGTEANSARYGLQNGGAVSPFTGQVIDFDFVQPEQLTAWEIGYKGVIENQLMVDINYYHNWYQNFINQQIVASTRETVHQGVTLPAGTLFNPYLNAQEEITSQGVGVGLTWNLPKGFVATGNYEWATFNLDENENSVFIPDFNTPENRFNLGFSNREVVKNFGFNVTYRWQQQFFWWNTFGEGNIPSFGLLNAQLSYKVKSLKSIVKIGGTNILGDDYRTNIGAPFIGQTYYISITFDEFMR